MIVKRRFETNVSNIGEENEGVVKRLRRLERMNGERLVKKAGQSWGGGDQKPYEVMK